MSSMKEQERVSEAMQLLRRLSDAERFAVDDYIKRQQDMKRQWAQRPYAELVIEMAPQAPRLLESLWRNGARSYHHHDLD